MTCKTWVPTAMSARTAIRVRSAGLRKIHLLGVLDRVDAEDGEAVRAGLLQSRRDVDVAHAEEVGELGGTRPILPGVILLFLDQEQTRRREVRVVENRRRELLGRHLGVLFVDVVGDDAEDGRGRRERRRRRRHLGRQRRLGLRDRHPGSGRADVHAATGEDERDREGPQSVHPRLPPIHGTTCAPAAPIT